MIEKKEFSFQQGGLNDKVLVFHSNIKRHLSTEFVRLNSTRDDLNSELTQLRVEKDQKDKQLFQNTEKRDSRRFFTPLNVVDIAKEEKDEKKKQLSMDMERIQDQIDQIDMRINEIKYLLTDIDDILDEVTSLKEQDELPTPTAINVPTLSKENNVSEDDTLIYPQLIRNLYNLADEFKCSDENVDILIEFNDHNIELDLSFNLFIINQLNFQIQEAIDQYDVNMILIQGEVTPTTVNLTLSYACENEKIDSLKLSYQVQR